MRPVLHCQRLGKRQHAALRGGIGILWHCTAHESHKRGNIDNGTTSLFEHDRDRIFRAQEGALDIDIHDAIPGCLGYIGHAAIVIGHNTGIVIQHIDTPKSLDSTGHHRLHRSFIGYVGFYSDGLTTCRPNTLDGFLCRLNVQVHNNDASPLLRKEERGRLPHSAGRSGDDRHLIRQSHTPHESSLDCKSCTSVFYHARTRFSSCRLSAISHLASARQKSLCHCVRKSGKSATVTSARRLFTACCAFKLALNHDRLTQTSLDGCQLLSRALYLRPFEPVAHADHPPDNQNRQCPQHNHRGVVESHQRNRIGRWQHEENRDEDNPDHSNYPDRLAPCS